MELITFTIMILEIKTIIYEIKNLFNEKNSRLASTD